MHFRVEFTEKKEKEKGPISRRLRTRDFQNQSPIINHLCDHLSRMNIEQSRWKVEEKSST